MWQGNANEKISNQDEVNKNLEMLLNKDILNL
jgi:hypothetical protein